MRASFWAALSASVDATAASDDVGSNSVAFDWPDRSAAASWAALDDTNSLDWSFGAAFFLSAARLSAKVRLMGAWSAGRISALFAVRTRPSNALPCNPSTQASASEGNTYVTNP